MVEIEHIVEDFPHRLYDDREVVEPAGDLQEVARSETLKPERSPLPRGGPGHQERPRGVLPELPSKQGRREDLVEHDQAGLIRYDIVENIRRERVRIRRTEQYAVIVVEHLGLDAGQPLKPAGEQESEESVHPSPERGVDDEPRVPDLVAERLNEYQPVVGDHPRGIPLLPKILTYVPSRAAVDRVLRPEPYEAFRKVDCLLHPSAEPPDVETEFIASSDPLPPPERHACGLAGSGTDGKPVCVNLLHPPHARPEYERIPVPRLVHELLVHFPHFGLPVPQVYTVISPVRDRSPVCHSKPAAPGERAEDPVHPVPGDACPELAKRLPGVPAGEHMDHAVEEGAGELPVTIRAADEVEELIRLPLFHAHNRHDLLGQHVEAVLGDGRLFHLVFDYPPRDDSRLYEVFTVRGKNPSFACRGDKVTRPADPLQPAGDPPGGLNLYHQVDAPDINPQFEGGCGDQRPDLSPLQVPLHLLPCLP